MSLRRLSFIAPLVLGVLVLCVAVVGAREWEPGGVETTVAVSDDPLVRMPGTQPGAGEVPTPGCSCHSGYDPAVAPMETWQGSMMSQAARDPLFWAALTVAAQDSNWAVGSPNGADICLRCHFPGGWLAGRSDPPNASAFTGGDYDGVQCGVCHHMYDPFYADTFAGTREGADWSGYWDEATTLSQTGAQNTRNADAARAQVLDYFNGNPYYSGDQPPAGYTENGGGQFFVDLVDNTHRRASFADANVKNHTLYYSRYHKSKYFCSSCHDVSNPVLQNLDYAGATPQSGVVLPTEENPAYSYYHVERTFSEFMLSAYGQQGGAAGEGPYAPAVFETSRPGDYIATCQDCHMRDVVGQAANQGVMRPTDSAEHPKSGLPLHDMSGGNVWLTAVLASTVSGSPNYDATNDQLLNGNTVTLTLDLTQGLGLNEIALLNGQASAAQTLLNAARLEVLDYTVDAAGGALTVRIHNQTGHKLISGYPEGRRMFLNVRAFDDDGLLVYEINPYDESASTLKGLTYDYTTTLPLPASLTASEVYSDALVYEMKPKSGLTGEDETHHFVLATDRYKDNRIPPNGFRIEDAGERLVQPVWQGAVTPDYFTAAEYAGGYDEVTLGGLPTEAISVEVKLYYQVTSREYVEFLRGEINGTGNTLPQVDSDPYVVQTDPFFAALTGWGDTIWKLWLNTRDWPGAAPFLMAETAWNGVPPDAPTASISIDGTDARIDWEHETANADYPVWRSGEPYFTDGPEVMLVATVTPTTGAPEGTLLNYADPGVVGAPAEWFFYRVGGRNQFGVAPSNRVGVVEFVLVPGE